MPVKRRSSRSRRTVDSLRDKNAVPGWLHNTAYRCAIEIQRNNSRWLDKTDRLKRRVEQAQTAAPREINSPDRQIANEELSAVLDAELTRLPAKWYQAIVLCDLEGKSQKTSGEATWNCTADSQRPRFERSKVAASSSAEAWIHSHAGRLGHLHRGVERTGVGRRNDFRCEADSKRCKRSTRRANRPARWAFQQPFFKQQTV